MPRRRPLSRMSAQPGASPPLPARAYFQRCHRTRTSLPSAVFVSWTGRDRLKARKRIHNRGAHTSGVCRHHRAVDRTCRRLYARSVPTRHPHPTRCDLRRHRHRQSHRWLPRGASGSRQSSRRTSLRSWYRQASCQTSQWSDHPRQCPELAVQQTYRRRYRLHPLPHPVLSWRVKRPLNVPERTQTPEYRAQTPVGALPGPQGAPARLFSGTRLCPSPSGLKIVALRRFGGDDFY